MNIFLGVRVFVMVAMVTCPPEGSFLGTGCSKKRKKKLKGAARLVSAMRKIAVIGASYGKHPYQVEANADEKSGPAESGPDNEEAAEVDKPKNGLF